MEDLSPRPGDLEPIETASVDELRALQTERLVATVRHAYQHVAHYRAAFDAAGTASPVGSAGRPCVGVSSLGVDSRGDLIVRQARHREVLRRPGQEPDQPAQHHAAAEGGRRRPGRA